MPMNPMGDVVKKRFDYTELHDKGVAMAPTCYSQ